MPQFVNANQQVEQQHHLQRDENVMKNAHAKSVVSIIPTHFGFTMA
jgi:hypothetical protein